MRRRLAPTSLLTFLAIAACDAAPPAHRVSMLALGDSYTIGESVSPTERWPAVLAARLRAASVDVGDPTIVAQTGWTTDELSSAIDARGLDGKTFDLVTLMIGVNDQFRGRSPESFRPAFVALVRRSIAFAGGEPRRVIVVSIPDWGAMPFAEGRDRAAIAGEIDAFNAIVREEATRVGTRFVDVTPISRGATTRPSLVAGDGLHPSAEQHRLWAASVASSWRGPPARD